MCPADSLREAVPVREADAASARPHTEDPLRDLGVRTHANGGTIRVWSANAASVELVVFDPADLERPIARSPLARDAHGVWEAHSPALVAGAVYGLRVDGPDGPPHAFDPGRALLDPWARGLHPAADGTFRGVVLDPLAEEGFDWGGVGKPRVPLDRTVVYETHLTGFSRLNERIPEPLRGTYAGLAHDASLEYLTGLGVTTIELLPVHAFATEEWLRRKGRANYWGYNTVGYFAPHAPYASAEARAGGAAAVRHEFAGMVRRLHEAGLEVVLDVVYNHTAEEGQGGPTLSLRGIDQASYYRHDAHGRPVDTTGCGNTIDFGTDAAVRLVLDSMRYWAGELQVDGFRLDLAATLGRDAHGTFTPEHPLLQGMLDDPVIGAGKLIAEPWDVGPFGWQTGGFPPGFTEWNDRYRDRMRDFWLGDLRRERHGEPGSGIGRFATRLAGSSNTFAADRGPLASLNFITAHDGFTLADLTAYDVKHNEANGEQNRDGTDHNNSYNHGVEGPTDDEGACGASAQHPQPARNPAALGGRADAHGRRRVRAQPARQQQRVLPRLRTHLAHVGRRRTRRRPRGDHPAPAAAAPREPGPAAGRLRAARRARADRVADGLVHARRRHHDDRRMARPLPPHPAVPGCVDAPHRRVQPGAARRARLRDARRRAAADPPGRRRVRTAVGFRRRGAGRRARHPRGAWGSRRRGAAVDAALPCPRRIASRLMSGLVR
ncbi:hypothetical protein GCM10025870_32730 [Agromyces marinus]|uniref:Glycosyl hydrolase family 13 catalytic domain-containing protein n=1 Tax=Agromyces marinus TaxID=1389020 RepID=A0ABM8H5T8_9MICO|nr:hypothetical protein GCM10025870_32730 [Agromyces marinus]